MQELPATHMPDYSHLAPKLHGKERLDVAVAAVAQAASAAAAAAAAAVISAAGEQVRAVMQVSQLPFDYLLISAAQCSYLCVPWL